MQLFDGLLVVTKVFLATDKDNGKTLAEVQDFGDPLRRDHALVDGRRWSVGSYVDSSWTHLLLHVVQRIG